MLAATHTIVGATIGTHTDSITLAFILGFISHFILDVIPHWSFKITELFKAGIEFGIGLLIAFLLVLNSNIELLPVIAGIIGANLPDIIVIIILNFFPKYKNNFFTKFHSKIQKEISFWPGIASQIPIFIICACLIILVR